MGIHQEKQLCHVHYDHFVALLLNRVQLLKERICSQRSKFFPLRVGPIPEGFPCPGKQTRSHRSCFPSKEENMVVIYPHCNCALFSESVAAEKTARLC